MTELWVVTSVIIGFLASTCVAGLLVRKGFPLPAGPRIGNVDGLRGYLALSVMAHHYIIFLGYKAHKSWEYPSEKLYNQFGLTAVSLFFMATGLVFYPKVLKSLTKNNWVSIYVGRIFRIVPLLLVSTLTCALVISLEHDVTPDQYFPAQVIKWLIGWEVPLMGVADSNVVNAKVFWSIYWEWTFYFFILPLASVLPIFIDKSRMWIALSVMLVALFLLRLVSSHVPVFFPLFIIGMLAAEIASRPSLSTLLSQHWVAVLMVLVLAGVMTSYHEPYGWAPMLMLGFVFTSIACGNTLFGILSTFGAKMLGEISFSIYVLHGIVLYLWQMIDWIPVNIFTLTVLNIVILLLASVVFIFLEKPFVSVGKRLYSSLADRTKRFSFGREAGWP